MLRKLRGKLSNNIGKYFDILKWFKKCRVIRFYTSKYIKISYGKFIVFFSVEI